MADPSASCVYGAPPEEVYRLYVSLGRASSPSEPLPAIVNRSRRQLSSTDFSRFPVDKNGRRVRNERAPPLTLETPFPDLWKCQPIAGRGHFHCSAPPMCCVTLCWRTLHPWCGNWSVRLRTTCQSQTPKPWLKPCSTGRHYSRSPSVNLPNLFQGVRRKSRHGIVSRTAHQPERCQSQSLHAPVRMRPFHPYGGPSAPAENWNRAARFSCRSRRTEWPYRLYRSTGRPCVCVA